MSSSKCTKYWISFVIFICLFFQPSVFSLEPLPKRVAICYWGLTRSTKKVYTTHFKMIFDQLENSNISYDIFMHTWELKGKQRVWDNELVTPIDYKEYELLQPDYYQIDKQDDFTENLIFEDYYYKDDPRGEWYPLLILNHLCALESLKRVTEMVENSGNEYDYVMYVRPDSCFIIPLDTNFILSLKNNEIIIPNFEHHTGYNDRFAILTYKTAPIYGKRIDHIIQYRKNINYIIAERYLCYTCNKNKLQVKLINFPFSLVRP
jgi:hypothetical protein